jgi:membrane-associated phospholipid phosphatase
MAVSHLIAANGPAEAAFVGLFIAGAVFGFGWMYGHRTSNWWPTSLRAGGLLLAVAVLALQVCDRGWLIDVDHSVTGWFVTHRHPAIDHIALAVTNVFGPVETAALAALAAAVVGWRFRSFLLSLTVIVTVGGASVLCSLIKLIVVRARPPMAVQETLETDYSFPSGHVTGTAALFGIIAVAIGLGRSHVVKSLLATLAVLVVSAVGLSRLYLGVHWFTDVIAGALLAAAAVTLGGTTLRALVDDPSPAEPQAITPASHHEALR